MTQFVMDWTFSQSDGHRRFTLHRRCGRHRVFCALVALIFLCVPLTAVRSDAQAIEQEPSSTAQTMPSGFYHEDGLIYQPLSETSIEAMIEDLQDTPNPLVRSIAKSEALRSRLELTDTQDKKITELTAKLDTEISALTLEYSTKARGLKSPQEIEKIQFEYYDKTKVASDKVVTEIREEILVPAQIETLEQMKELQNLNMLARSTRNRAPWGFVLAKFFHLNKMESEVFSKRVESIEKELEADIRKAKQAAAKRMFSELPTYAQKELIRRLGDDKEKLVELFFK